MNPVVPPEPFLHADPALLDAVEASDREGACWTAAGGSLDVNLVAWSSPHGVERHVNAACDVLVIGLRGIGSIDVDRSEEPLVPGSTFLVPRGTSRAIHARTRLVYLTCHPRQSRTFAPESLLGARGSAGGPR